MKPLKILSIQKSMKKKKVYDIHHKIVDKNFFNDHPNIIANGTIISNCSRHAGGCLISENLSSNMPLVRSGDTVQSPWSEGMNVRQLEPLGFIKFDILGLASLRMIETCIEHILKRHHNIENPTFEDIKKFYNENLHPDKINLDDQKVYENVFCSGRFAGIFQFTEENAQNYCKMVQPKSIYDVCAITSIQRPGPIGIGADKLYLEAKRNPEGIRYLHPLMREVLQDTYGFVIYQEQIANLVHVLGKDIDLNEANKFRKLLTKKGIGEVGEEKEKIYNKFIQGCLEKGISMRDAEELYKSLESFNNYGFNFSHGLSYSILSFQCAYLLTYYEPEWFAAFLDKDDAKKELAIGMAKQFGYNIMPIDINLSGKVWEISQDGKTLIQPLSSVKGIGETAVEQILKNRPFNTMDEILFNENISYQKLNKKSFDALVKVGALHSLLAPIFNNDKHLWCVLQSDYKKSKNKYNDAIEAFKNEPDFTRSEKISYLVELTGIFPMDQIVSEQLFARLEKNNIPPISEYDPDKQICWFVVKNAVKNLTKRGKDYYVVDVTDSNNVELSIKIWGIKKDDNIEIGRPYIAKLDYEEQWGFSSRALQGNFRIIG